MVLPITDCFLFLVFVPSFHFSAFCCRLSSEMTEDGESFDQLTVNKYEIGDGIPPHVDTHGAFGPLIYSLR